MIFGFLQSSVSRPSSFSEAGVYSGLVAVTGSGVTSRSRVTDAGGNRLCHGTVTGNPPAAQRVRAGPHSDPAQYTVRGTVTGGRRLGPRRPTKKLEAAAVPGHRVPAARVARRRFKLPASTVTSTLPGPGWSHVFVALATVTCQPASASHGESRNFKLKLPG